jgi:hypothetical protein
MIKIAGDWGFVNYGKTLRENIVGKEEGKRRERQKEIGKNSWGQPHSSQKKYPGGLDFNRMKNSQDNFSMG